MAPRGWATSGPARLSHPPLQSLLSIASPFGRCLCLGHPLRHLCFDGLKIETRASAEGVYTIPYLALGTYRVSAEMQGFKRIVKTDVVLNSGATVTLSWTAPAAGVPTSYVVEASSAPGGPANLANFDTGNTLTTLTVTAVPALVRDSAMDRRQRERRGRLRPGKSHRAGPAISSAVSSPPRWPRPTATCP